MQKDKQLTNKKCLVYCVQMIVKLIYTAYHMYILTSVTNEYTCTKHKLNINALNYMFDIKTNSTFSCRLCFLRVFSFISLILLTTAGVQCLCGGCKKSPRTTSLCSHILLVLRECTCMLFTFENGNLLMRQRASVVCHHSLLLMNGFNKTEAAVFSCRLCFLRAFPFISLLLEFLFIGRRQYMSLFSYLNDTLRRHDTQHVFLFSFNDF